MNEIYLKCAFLKVSIKIFFKSNERHKMQNLPLNFTLYTIYITKRVLYRKYKNNCD